MLTGQNGILNRASEAKEKTEIASKDEQRKLAQAEALMNTGKTTYKGLTLPEGFAPTKIEGEDSIDDGLVITDGYGNEYVWVEVPRTSEVYPTATVNITEFNNNAYTNIENDLHTYTSLYRNNTSYTDTYFADDALGWFKDASEYNEAKYKMLKSVYENEGFWVGRYEAGIEKNRTNSGEATIIPMSKANLYPYTYVTRTQAKLLAEKVESGSYTSSLMFGVQWDLILVFMYKNGKIDNNLLISDSTTIGNYKNSELILNRGMFAQYSKLDKWYSFNSNEQSDSVFEKKKKSQSEEKNTVLLTTGASEMTNIQNIYDIAGNVIEWTLEYSSSDIRPRVYRGGHYYIIGNVAASFRADNTNSDYCFNDIGFRVTIY